MQIIKKDDQKSALSKLQQRQNDLWHDFWNFGFSGYPVIETANNFLPKVDIIENKKSFVIKADLPNVDPEKVNVEVDGNILIISGQTEEENEEKGTNFHRVERVSGSFYRSFELPPTADLGKTECSAKNGVLKIKIPKKSETKGKKLKVKVEK